MGAGCRSEANRQPQARVTGKSLVTSPKPSSRLPPTSYPLQKRPQKPTSHFLRLTSYVSLLTSHLYYPPTNRCQIRKVAFARFRV